LPALSKACVEFSVRGPLQDSGAFRRDLLLLLAIGYLYLWRFFTKTAPRPWLTSRRSRILSQEDSHAR